MSDGLDRAFLSERLALASDDSRALTDTFIISAASLLEKPE